VPPTLQPPIIAAPPGITSSTAQKIPGATFSISAGTMCRWQTKIRKAIYLQLTRMEQFSHLKTYTTQMAEQDTKGDKTCCSDAGCVFQPRLTQSSFIFL